MSYVKKNLREVEDSALKHGLSNTRGKRRRTTTEADS